MDFIHKKTRNITHVYNEEHIKFYRSNPNYKEIKKEVKQAKKSASSVSKKKKEVIKNGIEKWHQRSCC